MSWLTGRRTVAATDQILDAAAALFAAEGLDGPGMEELARAAGCSRATLYRYFPTRSALLAAFAEREAITILDEVAATYRADGGVAGYAVACLTAVRARPHLTAWYAADGGQQLLAVLVGSARIRSYLRGALGRGEDGDRELPQLFLRVLVSLLVTPGADTHEEHALLARLTPDTQPRAPR
ncbi:TetR/AcrR family transcriptional regulator [Nocardioides sp. GY 10113]|uniref:TetR/AcrR family transcriptional regulator n=1 Tax=Nocardioides sp. GY 10113 TaxID=2569761 RepID=UPI001458D576|nr:TetR/AcrR family transcriptional regulator [Nocardioides sp. GY 10113]